MEKSKIETYLGFCVRARKIIFGTEMIERQKKGVFLLIVDSGTGKNSVKEMVNAKEKFSCPLLTTDKEGALAATLHRPSVKAVAITDQNLAAAILNALGGEPQFKLYSGGNN